MSALDTAPRTELVPSDELWPALVPVTEEFQRLCVLGDPAALSAPCLSVTGPRRATPYGTAVAEMAGRAAAGLGVCVVTGGSLGACAAAMRAALDAGGKTVVVAGTGADVAYPSQSRGLFERAVGQGGCVVSLENWGARPTRERFLRRNRPMAALSPVLVAAEAGAPSGALALAEAARALGRRVCAAPSPILSTSCKGANHLIAQGATIIEDEPSFERSLCDEYGARRP